MRETFGADNYNTDNNGATADALLYTAMDESLISDEQIDGKETPERLWQVLSFKVKSYHGQDSFELVEKAYKLALSKHEGVLRKSGEPYIIHPLWVAIILSDMELDDETIAAGLLHDVVEDTDTTTAQIKEMFGDEVAKLVDGVTKLGQLNYEADKIDVQAENLRKMLLAMSKDIRVILIKLADRLHNMRTLEYMSPSKQLEKARETMDIYAPIAGRLGISKIKDELDDIALSYTKPEEYRELVHAVNERESEREEYIKTLVADVTERMKDVDLKCEVYGRVKHFFSIYKKMVNQHKSVDEIYDLFAVRILVDDVADCYAALGAIHDKYTPVPGRFKDYIAMPKPNRYQSLHTTLIGPTGQPFEIQIRTYEMHRIAEYGIAAHWKYKASGGSTELNVQDNDEAKMSWLREVLEWQQSMSDNKEFMSLIKTDLDLFSDHVYCFTPEGDIKNLPVGSTPIDFAYAIHSAVGNKMVGARVNGKLVPIDYEIQNGDRIYVMTSQNSTGPSRDWLNIVKSAGARNKINQWFKKEFKDENISRGKDLLLAYCKTKSIKWSDLNKPSYQKAAQRKYGFKTWDQLLATIGHGGLKEGQVVNRLLEEKEKEEKEHITDDEIISNIKDSSKAIKISTSGVIVKGMANMDVRFAKCCTPVPGDEIIGFVTRGRGVTVHRTDCINLINLPQGDRARLIPVEWAEDTYQSIYHVEIRLYCSKKQGLLVEVSRTFSELEVDIASLNARTSKKGIATVQVAFSVHSSNELNKVMEKLRQIDGVNDIERITG